jgi:hypothetical protein
MTDEISVFRPTHERKLLFRGKEIATADLKDGKGYVSVRSLCEAFGLNVGAQRKRLLRQQGYFSPFTATILLSTAGGPQPALCLMASAVPLFLTGVELERVEDEQSRLLLKAFLDEAHTVLAEHFGISERGELQFLRESIARMVAEQESFEETLSKKVNAELAELRKAQDEKVQQIRDAFGNLRQQVTRIEAVAGPRARLTPEQLGQLREIVATLGSLLQESGVAKPYPGIYMDITRLTGVSRSEDIRQEDFRMVVEFLEEQVRSLARKPASRPPSAPQER